MTFVYPFLLGGLLLAGLPVLLHFLVRKKPKTLLFPAFRFLMQKQRSNTRNLRLRHLLLLLLRVALLVLLCLALARPRLFQGQIGISRERPIALVLVFDTSPSMEYKRDEMTRLDLAKKRGLELLDQLPDGCRILVVDSGESRRDEWTHSLEKARQRVNGLAIRHNNGPVTRTIDEAMRRFSKLDEAAGELPRFVCIFSDRTRASWDRLANPKPAEVQMLYFDFGLDAPGLDAPIDLAITHVELPRSHRGEMRQSFAAGEKIAVRVVVKATGKEHEGTLSCKIGNRDLKQTILPIVAGEQQTLSFEIDSDAWSLGPGFHQAEIRLDAVTDALPFNNQRYVTFKIRERTPVLVLADGNKADRLASALKALLYAVDVQAPNAEVVLGNYAAVFLDGIAAPSESLWQALAAYVERGGGVGIIPAGDYLQPSAYNSDAARRVMPATMGRKITVAKGEAAMWADDLLHPFMLPYAAWVEEGSSDFLRYPRGAYYYWEVTPQKKAPTTVVVSYQDRRPALVERFGKGTVLLLTTPLEAEQPEWTNYHASHTSFRVALPYLCARHLIHEPANPNLNFQFGADPPSTQAPLVESPKYLLSGPEFAEEIRFDNSRWVGDRLPRAGNYSLVGTDSDKEQAKSIVQFSINVPGEESDLTRIPLSEIEAALGKDSVVPQDRRRTLVDSLNWNEPIELFPWLMLALLLFLAIENLLANRFYRAEPA